MCQTAGNCFVEDPLAEEKNASWNALWEARRFVEENSTGTSEQLAAHQKDKGVPISLQRLKKLVSEILARLEREQFAPLSQQAYRKILALLPE